MAGTAGTGAADPIGAVIATAAPAVFIHSPHRAPPGMPAASHPAPTAGICAPASTTNRLTASPEPPITARTRRRRPALPLTAPATAKVLQHAR